MCGITGIILKNSQRDPVASILQMNDAIRHRGPDGEGFVSTDFHQIVPCYRQQDPGYQRKDLAFIPKHALPSAPPAKLVFGHRRLAIIDLSETGHQPMCNVSGDHWIVFNGEIYNYIEIRNELKQRGRTFITQSDTEVVLQSYEEWGFDCVQRFNGMWAFCIYDRQRQICFASRDRLGVKPFYYLNTKELFAFASEQKALVNAGLASASVNENTLFQYLANGLLEYEEKNFFENITELWPGTNLVYDVAHGELKIQEYYRIRPTLVNNELSEDALIAKIKTSFEQSVDLRLRSDVEVGTCLSGGIDSSALAVSISQLTGKPLHCFTSVFRGQSFNEEHFADLLAAAIQARHHKVEPSLEGLQMEMNDLVYSQDVPIWSTSTYAQYKVMELAKLNHIKVVLDGQGADELFAGYHHHFIAQWNSLWHQGKYSEALREMNASKKTFAQPWLFYTKEKIKSKFAVHRSELQSFFKPDFLAQGEIEKSRYYSDVNEQLLDDIYRTRLKSFLKCEDRCGMWHSVESRTPFSDDVELIDLLFSFHGDKKIKNGISKYLLREAVKEKLPKEIYQRYDKKGFQTPMSDWLSALRPQLLAEIRDANFPFVNYRNLEKSQLNSPFEQELFFKLFVLVRWQHVFSR